MIVAGSSKIAYLLCVTPALFEFEGEAPIQARAPRRVRDLGLELVSVQPQPAADPTTTTHIRKDL
jgi:hypothetical protein